MHGWMPQARMRVALWLLFISLCVIILFFNLRFSYDLGVFLPEPQTDAQKVLIERLGQGPGSRFLLLGLKGANPDKVQKAREALQASNVFTRVISEESIPDLADIPEVVWRYRYLLSDTPINAATLGKALKQRAADLALFSGEEFNTLTRADPGFVSLEIIQGLAATIPSTDKWVTDDGVALLVVETSTPAFDLSGQKTAVEASRKTLTSVAGFQPEEIEISGVGAFGVELQETIQSEASKRSVLASAGLALVLLLSYRRWSLLLLAAVPLLTGALAGLGAVALIFPQVHGITLAFGFTLLGIAIDYPLHLFSHARRQTSASAINNIWPTLRLGAASTLIAYTGIALSGAQGLAQLGIFTAVGVTSAALTTRWVLPFVTTLKAATSGAGSAVDHPNASVRIRWSPLVVLLIMGSGLMFIAWKNTGNGSIWNNSLSSLSPIPEHRLARDHELRQLAGTPDLRFVIALRHPDLQRTLQATEVLNKKLHTAADIGLISHWQSVTQVLPSENSQLRRQREIPGAAKVEEILNQAVAGTPFALSAFTSFQQDIAASRKLPLLKLSDFKGSSIQGFVDNHLYQHDGKWTSIISLYHPTDVSAFEDWLAETDTTAVLVDFKSASESLVADYRSHTLNVLAIALFLILGLLLWRLSKWRALWSLASVLSVLAATAAIVSLQAGALNLYHLMALLLVAGLGLDYVLFMSRKEESTLNRSDTRHAVIACAVSTSVAFGILGMSAIPALQSMGRTVAIGSVLSFLIAWLGISAVIPPECYVLRTNQADRR